MVDTEYRLELKNFRGDVLDAFTGTPRQLVDQLDAKAKAAKVTDPSWPAYRMWADVIRERYNLDH